jgi:hypothetical protein
VAEAIKISGMNLGEKARFRLAIANLKQGKVCSALSYVVNYISFLSDF